MGMRKIAFLLTAAYVFATANAHELADITELDEASTPKTMDTASLEKLLWQNVEEQLHSPHWQWLNALIFLAFGILMTFGKGTKSFKWTVISMFGFAVYIVSMSQIHEIWEADLGKLCSVIVGAEIAVMAMVTIYFGWDAVMYCLGAIVGLLLSAWLKGKFAYHVGDDFANNRWFLFVMGNICIIGGLYLFSGGTLTDWVKSIICAFFGALLLTSSLAYWIGVLSTFWVKNLAKMGITINEDSPCGGYWIDYLLVITSPDNKDMGVFSSLTTKGFTLFGSFYHLDCIIGRVFWILIFGVGILVLVLRTKKDKARAAEEKKKDEKPSAKAQQKPQAKKAPEAAPTASSAPPAKTPDKKKGFSMPWSKGGSKSQPLLA